MENEIRREKNMELPPEEKLLLAVVGLSNALEKFRKVNAGQGDEWNFERKYGVGPEKIEQLVEALKRADALMEELLAKEVE